VKLVSDGRGFRQVSLQAGDLPAGLRVPGLILILAGGRKNINNNKKKDGT